MKRRTAAAPHAQWQRHFCGYDDGIFPHCLRPRGSAQRVQQAT